MWTRGNADDPATGNATAVQGPPAGEVLLLATNGTEASGNALAAARALAPRVGGRVSVVSVFTPAIPYPAGASPPRHESVAPSDRSAANRQISAVRRQMEAVPDAAAELSVDLEVGEVALRISERAERDAAAVLVIGLGRAAPSDRCNGDHAAIAIAMSSPVPVLAVAAGFRAAPRRMLLAVGLDELAIAGARCASRFLLPADEICLVHVAEPLKFGSGRPPPDSPGGAPPPSPDGAFLAVREAFSLPIESKITTHILDGEPAHALLSFAREHHVDLIVSGLRGRNSTERTLLRNTGLQILAGAECSVLLTPERG